MKESSKKLIEMAGSIQELATMICCHGSYAYHNDNRDYPIPKDAIKEYLEMGAAFSQQQMMKDAKLSGWVARDENGSLHLFEVEPSRIMHRWWDRDYHSTTLDNKDFPDLEWENEPVYVKLPIIMED